MNIDMEKLYKEVNSFCQKQPFTVNTVEKNHIINGIVSTLLENNKNSKSNPNNSLDLLLTESNLEHSLSSAKEFYTSFKNNFKSEVESKNKPSVFRTICINIVSNIIYSIIVALIVWACQDPISKFIGSLMKH